MDYINANQNVGIGTVYETLGRKEKKVKGKKGGEKESSNLDDFLS
jgi:hypothetical protein